MTSEHVGGRRAAALVWDVDHVETGTLEIKRHREMREAAVAARRVRDLAGLLARLVLELLQRPRRKARMQDEHEWIGADVADRREVLDRIVGELAHRGRNREVRQRGHEQ